MLTTTLSSKGQVIIPKDLRDQLRWKPGQVFEVVQTEEGVLLRPRDPFPRTTLDEVAGCLHRDGPALSLADMDAAVADAIHTRYSREGS